MILNCIQLFEGVNDRDLSSRGLDYHRDGCIMLSTGNGQTKYELSIVLTGSLNVLLFVSVSSGPAFVERQTANW